MADPSEPQSWGETIRAYENSKKNLPWSAKEVTPVEKLGAFERRTLEREVDPVLMQYRDPSKEQAFSTTLQAKTDAKKTKGQAGQPFNIVNHEGPPRKNVLLGHQPRGNREWNLLSHFPDKLHTKAPTKFNEDYQIECTKRKSLLAGLTLTRGRDYSILSNKFNEDNSARCLAEHENVQDHLRSEYTRTRIYDPIKVQSYDEDKEKQWQVSHKQQLARNRERQEEFIPQSTKYAEGNTYNILTTKVTNADRLLQIPDKALNRYKGSATKVQAAKCVGDQRATVEDSRRMNRISYDRWEATIDRGYDFVFGGPVQMKPAPRPKPSIWSRLHSSESEEQTSERRGGGESGKTSQHSFRARDLSGAPSSGQLRRSLSSSTPSSPHTHTTSQSQSQSQSSGNNISNTPYNSSRSSPQLSAAHSQRSSIHSSRVSTSVPVPALDLNVCPHSPVRYSVPKNSLPGEPIAMVRTGGGLSSY